MSILKKITAAFCAEGTDILDWYDGPMLSRAFIDEKEYYYIIKTIGRGLDEYWVVNIPQHLKSCDSETLGLTKLNAILGGVETYPESAPKIYILNTKDDITRESTHEEYLNWTSDCRDDDVVSDAICHYLNVGARKFEVSNDILEDTISNGDTSKLKPSTDTVEAAKHLLYCAGIYNGDKAIGSKSLIIELIQNSDSIEGSYLTTKLYDPEEAIKVMYRIDTTAGTKITIELEVPTLLEQLPQDIKDALSAAFTDINHGLNWLKTSLVFLDGKRPIDVLKDMNGTDEQIINKLEEIATLNELNHA